MLRVFVGLTRQRVVAESVGEKLGTLLQASLMDDELADEVHQLVEASNVDADGLLGGLESIARDGHPLALREASCFCSEVCLAALGNAWRPGRVLVVGASGTERRRLLIARAVDVDAERRLHSFVFGRAEGSGHCLYADDIVDCGEALAKIEQLDRTTLDQHRQHHRPEARFDLLAARHGRDQVPCLFGLEHQLKQSNRLPLAHRIDAADEDRSWLESARRLDQQTMNERRNGEVAHAFVDYLGLVDRGLGRFGLVGEVGDCHNRAGRRPRCRFGCGGTSCGRRSGAGEQLAELLGQGLRGLGQSLSLLDFGDQSAEHVDRCQQNIREGLHVVEGSASEGPEEVFHGMGQFGHAAVADRGGRSLEGVSRAEDFVDYGGVKVVLEVEQALFDPFDLFHGLVGEETVVPLLQIEGQAHVRRPLAERRAASHRRKRWKAARRGAGSRRWTGAPHGPRGPAAG